MKSDILVGLIKEVVKTEVKHQVKEELIKLIKSGIVTVNKEVPKKKEPSLKNITEMVTNNIKPEYKNQKSNKIKEITKNPILNEILSQTEPFTSAHRVEGGPMLGVAGGSILDALQPSVSMEGDWETMDYRSMNVPEMPVQPQVTDNPSLDALTKALTRDYRELVKRF